MQPDNAPLGDGEPAAVRVVDDIVELVSLVELEDVYLWEERGRRIHETATDDDSEPSVRNVLNVADRTDGLGFGFRFRMIFDDRRSNEFVADFQAQYETAEVLQISKELKAEFAERVAFFTVYPYLRASVQMTASRMGAPAPVLSIVRAGEFKLGSEMTGDGAASAFEDREPER